MFLTSPQFAARGYAPFLEPGVTAWRAVRLTSRFAWFIMTVEGREAELEVWTDVLVANADEVRHAFESDESRMIVALHMLQPDRDCSSTWRCRRIQQVWLATLDDPSRKIVFFSDEDGEFCVDHGADITAEVRVRARALLADLRDRAA